MSFGRIWCVVVMVDVLSVEILAGSMPTTSLTAQ